MVSTPLRIGDRVENAISGPGTVEGFGYTDGEGEHVRVLFDSCPLEVRRFSRHQLQRVRGTTDGVISVGRH